MNNNEIRINVNKSWIIAILSVLVILLIGYIVYTNFINKENTNINNNNDVKEETNTYKVEDYISIETVETDSSKIKLEKINFKNIDSNLVADFIEKQNSIINEYQYVKDSETADDDDLKSKIFYQINDNVLSIRYDVEGPIATNMLDGYNCDMFTLNIDLENNKILTTTDILNLKGIDINDYATKLYDEVIYEHVLQFDDNMTVYDNEYKEYSKQEFLNNKLSHINKIIDNLDDFNVVIRDNKVNVIYTNPQLINVCVAYGVGGCFEKIVDEL